MITFQIAPTVQPGQPLTSRQINSQSRAFTDRILSGAGNCAERIVDYAWGLGRQIRNPADVGDLSIGQWPSADEWLRIYAYKDPQLGGPPWPEDGMEPGYPKGVSLSNPLGAFVFGNTASGLFSEEDRLSNDVDLGVPLWLNFGNGFREPQTAEESWALGKQQRGGIDPATGLMSARVITAAQSHYRIQYPYWQRFLAAYGGMLPTRRECTDPEVGAPVGCGDVLFYDDGGAAYETPRFEVIFTPTAYGTSLGRTVKHYSGFCPAGSPNAGVDCNGNAVPTLAGIGYGEWWYTLYEWSADGQGGYVANVREQLSTAEYVEGPYSGGGIMGRDVAGGRHLNVAMNWFLHDFRGSREQIAEDSYDPASTAFPFGKFFARQFLLSPAKGVVQGDEIVVSYPRFTWSASCPGGTRGALPGGAIRYAIAASFVCAGACVVVTGLQSPVGVRILNDDTGQHLAELSLTPDESGRASASWWPEAAARLAISAEVVGDLALDGGSLWVELAELWEWKPSIADAYVVLRLASTQGGAPSLDSDGFSVESPIGAYENYAKHGCIVNPGAAGVSTVTYITENPVYEAARRLIVGNVRLAARPQLLNYAVENGKSVFWFKRFAVLSNSGFDLFTGIAPSRTPVQNGKIQSGVQYRVQGGVILYDGVEFHTDETFTGHDTAAWELAEGSTGSEQVFEVTAIRRTAPPRGASNRWVMFGTFNGYSDVADSSLWKPDLYDNSILYHNRCHTLSPELRYKRALNMHFTFGQKLALISEALPAYTYAEGMNGGAGVGWKLSASARADHYRSCQLYPAPYEIESAVDELGDVVKVTLTGRLRHCPGAPASITPAPLTWSWLTGAALQYRTDENAICEYLRYMAGGAQCRDTSEPYADNPNPETGEPSGFPWQVGDMANPNELYKFTDTPKGACFPRLYFVRLPEEVWEDMNDEPDPQDTPVWMDTMAQREMYLRAMAGGFLDERSTTTLSCESGHLFDFSFENLCMAAFGGRALPIVKPSLANPWGGHGALPSTEFWTEPFNAVSSAVNLLRRVRVMLPIEVRSVVRSTGGRKVATPTFRQHPLTGGAGCDVGPEAVDTSLNAAWWDSVAGVPETGWYDSCAAPGSCPPQDGWDGAIGMRSAFPDVAPATGIRMLCQAGAYEYAIAGRLEYGWVTVNPDHPALLALSESMRAQFAANPGFLGWLETSEGWIVRDDEHGTSVTACGWEENTLPTSWSDGTIQQVVKFRTEFRSSRQCVLFDGGAIMPPALPATAMWYHHPLSAKACPDGAYSRVSFTPINDRDMYLAIPLGDHYEET